MQLDRWLEAGYVDRQAVVDGQGQGVQCHRQRRVG
jgi:hypothetical protein